VALNISGIRVEVRKKNIKNLHLYVKPPNGRVMVSAPLSMSDLAIERFVRTKTVWIKKQVSAFDAQPRQPKRQHVSGETLYVWGKQYFVRTEYANRYSLALCGNRAILTVRRNSTAAQREKFVREWHRALLKAEIARLLPKWEKATGLRAPSWQIKYMCTRWGTCNAKTGKIYADVERDKVNPKWPYAGFHGMSATDVQKAQNVQENN